MNPPASVDVVPEEFTVAEVVQESPGAGAAQAASEEGAHKRRRSHASGGGARTKGTRRTPQCRCITAKSCRIIIACVSSS